LHGSYRELGLSFEWHDFTAAKDVAWSRSFHPGSVEICLNLVGHGYASDGKERLVFAPMTAGFYRQEKDRLRGVRFAGQHQFLTVELSPGFLREQLCGDEANLHPIVQGVLKDGGSVAISEN